MNVQPQIRETETRPNSSTTLEPLTKAEIDRRMQWVASIVATTEGLEPVEGARPGVPQWIEASELVRRMRPFMVNN